MTKKELKQKIAEIFANDKIKFKSQEIRDLIDANVNEALDMKNNNSVYLSREELI